MHCLDQCCFEFIAVWVDLVEVIVAEALVRINSSNSLAPVIDS